ncbi:glycosyl hydrolase [Sphingobacterium sp. LRF_L2]|uniref:glycosyl hydrolase n=1 Tax=Sphingobacterium sp. LRF_L2 TaxID=3369421 RepID=UPI003F605B9D
MKAKTTCICRVVFFASLLLLMDLRIYAQSFDQTVKHFQVPPDSIRPYVYWYWINGHVSPSGVVQDLQAMKDIGIGGAFIGNIGLSKEEGTSYGDVKLFSPVWWEATQAAMETAGNLGITMGMFNSPGWSQSGGPWVRPEASMRYIGVRQECLEGGTKILKEVKKTGSDSTYLFSLAVPFKQMGRSIVNRPPVMKASPEIADLSMLVDGVTNRFIPIGENEKMVTLDFKFLEDLRSQSLTLYPSSQPFAATITLQAELNGAFETVYVSDFDRSNTNLQTGFNPQAVLSLSFPLVKSDRYRLIFTNISGIPSFSEISLSADPVIDHYMEKQLAKMHATPLPLWDAYRWKKQEEPFENKGIIDPLKVIRLDEFVRADGKLDWEAPLGGYSLIHYYSVPTGITNSPAAVEGRGLEIDKMDASKLDDHFDAFIGNVLKRIPVNKRKTFKYMVADSYEVGSQNWTDRLFEKFHEIYGYDPLPYFPVLSGMPVGSVDASNRFLWDLRRLVADLVATEYVGGLRKIGNQHGLRLWLENYGHWGFPSEFLKYGGQSDEVAGEFWNEGDLGNIENKSASSAAHIYGKKRVWAESFTAGGGEYSRYPALLKRRGDWVFTQGVNQTLLHLYIHQPDQLTNPGINAWFSTEFNRKNTWFNASKSYIDYLRRCNYMLQQGNSVNDIAYFIGEDAPIMTGTRQPEIPEGYDYDYVNADVIHKMFVRDNYLCLPGGASYRILVLPPLPEMRPELLAKIKDLVYDGAVILGGAPLRSPSLEGYPYADEAVRKDAALLWGKKRPENGIRHVGKGLVIEGIDLSNALEYLGLNPDFTINGEGNICYTHRTSVGQEIYFITNQSEEKQKFTAAFRVGEGTPYWFDAVTGTVKKLTFENNAKGAEISLKLDVNESGFVVFDKHNESHTYLPLYSFQEPSTIQQIDNPWTVVFKSMPTKQNQDFTVQFKQLISWADHDDRSIRDFSGTAIYKNRFQIGRSEKNELLYLETDPIVGLATVRINGSPVGTLWTAPWRLDISDAVKEGDNSIEIEVVNTWKNSLIAQSKLPKEQQSLQIEINNYTPESLYDKAGLTGSVSIKTVKGK